MDINLPISLQNLSTLSIRVDNSLALKAGQIIDAKVIAPLLKAEINTIVLKLADNTMLNVQSNQPLKLAPGQDIRIQVTKVAPVLEFVIITSAGDSKQLSIPQDARLKLVNAPIEKQHPETNTRPQLPVNQPLAAKIISIAGNKMQLQVYTTPDPASAIKPQKTAESGVAKSFITITVTVDRPQLQMPKPKATFQPASVASVGAAPVKTAPEFKAGQTVMLVIDAKASTAQVKISVPPVAGEETVAQVVKQLLPKHESSPALLNQLIQDLPQLAKNNSVPETLQRIAAAILKNLPERQQLNDSAFLKHAIANSGLFLEAKIAGLKENPAALTIDQDFKANLFKLIQALKMEAVSSEKPDLQPLELSTLKNLQQKTENNVAKITLDQLASLQNEENPKQLWSIDIPFLDRERADTANLQISRDKDSNQQSDSDKWTVTITMHPPGLGVLQCKLSYYNETINTCFRSQQSETTELIGRHLDYLKQQLESAGLKTGLINVLDGLEPVKTVYQTAGNSLFDEQV